MTAEPNPAATLARALVAAQAQMPAVGKDSENPHFHSRFTSLDSLIAATRPILNQFGLALTQCPGRDDVGNPVLRSTLIHGPSGEQLQHETPLYLASPTMQNLGSATTYARRYAWASLLGIASEEDTDGNAAAHTEKSPEKSPTSQGAPAEKGPKMATDPQKAKMAVQLKQLVDDGVPLPQGFPGADTWKLVLIQHMKEEHGVTSRAELTTKQASEVIDWLEAQAIPF